MPPQVEQLDDEDLIDLDQDDETPEDSQEEEEAAPDDPLEGDEEAQKALLKLYGICKGEDRYARLVEVKDVKQAEFYWTGRQYIWWSQSDQKWNIPTQPSNSYDDIDVDDMPRFEFVTNIYQARGLMVIAAVTSAPPKVRWFPEDADNSDDIDTSDARSKLSKLIERWNPVQKLMQEEVYHAWTGGFIAWWSRYVADGEKYGMDSVDTLKMGEVQPEKTILCPQCGFSSPADLAVPPFPCPQCGRELTDQDIHEEAPISVPEDGGTEEKPKGRQIISCYGALNCPRPQHTKYQSQWHYFGIEEEVHYSIIRAAHTEKAEKIKPGANLGSEDVFERNARLSVAENTKLLSQTGANQASLCTYVHAWFRPTAFWMLNDEKQEAVRDRLFEKFPRGVHFEFTGSVYLTSKAKSMDDEIVSCHAMPGSGQHRPAVGTSLISVQDRVNTFSNIETETYEYGIPITYRASDTFNPEADENQRAAPGLEVEVALRPGEDLNSRIVQVRADSVSTGMQEHTAALVGPIADQLTGTYPGVTGAGEDSGAPDTVGQQQMQRDSGMGRMGIFYVNLKQARADLMTISCREFEANAEGKVSFPVLGASGDFESESVDVTALEGEAEAYPEGDENFPKLWNEQRAIMTSIMDTPYGAELVKDPDNAELFAKLSGIPELKVPGKDARQKQLKEIAELTKPPQEEGMAAGMAPMVEVDSDDYHDIESAVCKWWLNSGPGQKMKKENPDGWMAVKQHKAQHDAQIPQPPPAEKPLSKTVTSNVKDMPPEAQAQWFKKELGIEVNMQDFLHMVALRQAENVKPAPGPSGQSKPPTGEPAKPTVAAGGE